ncbi:S24 family peptidase [Streptomyces sp. NPDC046881]|uniref:S24 family peptidase n=1 Tax=Streptomyces sp. NPDC046881 TaxID=3155374 RepID=UPI0033D9689D
MSSRRCRQGSRPSRGPGPGVGRRVRTGVRAGAGTAWAGALVLLAAGADGPALICGLAALALTLGVAVPVCLGRRVVAVSVHGESMRPAYRDGDRVPVRRDRPPTPGRVVVVERPAAGGRWSAPPVPTPSPAVSG